MKTRNERAATVIAVLCAMLVYSLSAAGGSLEPGAPPGPTMKTLDEVEPRIPIKQADIPLTISQSGSYYFTGDVNAAGTAITVESNDVTIDLCGYKLTGPGSSSGTNYGIYMSARSNVEVRNGTIREFGSRGIYEADSTNGNNHRVVGVRAISTGTWAAICLNGNGHLVKDCSATDNISYGIYVGRGCVVTGNTVRGSYDGIHAGDGSVVTNNSAYNNSNGGITTSSGCTVSGNSAYFNNDGISASQHSIVTNNSTANNKRVGIFARDGCLVTGNTAGNNNTSDFSSFGAGIYIMGNCILKGNVTCFNKRHNIYVEGADNLIEENLMTNCTAGNGIYFETTGSFYANNRASGNSTDYTNTAGNTDGGGNESF